MTSAVNITSTAPQHKSVINFLLPTTSFQKIVCLFLESFIIRLTGKQFSEDFEIQFQEMSLGANQFIFDKKLVHT